MNIPVFVVDAFTDRVFGGNPAAVCPLDSWLEDNVLQSIAAEHNLSETAFFVPEGDSYHLRWFTPTTEVELCGHATVASAFVLMNCLSHSRPEVTFRSASGELNVAREGDLYMLDFPERRPVTAEPPPRLLESLGGTPREVLRSRDYLVVYDSEQDVRTLAPDITALAAIDMYAVIVTAPGTNVDFVSRFFAPGRGVPEDPVTGSAHCTLIPYWSERLGRTSLHALQVSKRGGELWCQMREKRVGISGRAVLYSSGTIQL